MTGLALRSAPTSPPVRAQSEARPSRFLTLGALYRDIERDGIEARPGFSRRMVGGEGPLDAGLMLIGEQPGDQEDLIGRPFVGPAGQLLDKCLAEAGIDRDHVFVTNAVKRFKYAQRGKRRLHQTPTAGDIAHYRWWLREEIRLVDPRVIIALGGTALLALTGRRTLASVRGRVLPWEDRKLIVTIHPSYLLRLREEPERWEQRDRFIRELETAAQSARTRVTAS